MAKGLDIVIPSKTEKFLYKTIIDVLGKTSETTHIYPVLDGYELPKEEIADDPRVHYIRLEPTRHSKKRQAINHVVKIGKGDYIMSLDAHCMVASGFDTILEKDHQPNWVQIPRRNRLDAENWCLQPQTNKPSIDYEYFMWQGLNKEDPSLHGYRWDARTHARAHIPLDDTLNFQGSCWFMTKKWFNKMGFMQIEGYGGWGQEAEEIGLKTRLRGGRVISNKNTWYAHLHKGKKYGRMYFMSRAANRRCYAYSTDLWLRKNKDFFISVVEGFMPIPNWPENWKDILWGKWLQ